MVTLEAAKEMLMKANEGKTDVIMTKWKDVLLREATNNLVHEKLAMTNTTNGQNAKEQYEIERRKNNVVARGV